MLGARCGTRRAGKLHGKAGEHERFHYRAGGFLILGCYLVGKSDHFSYGGHCQLGNGVAVIFVDKQMRDLPVKNAYVFCHHITESGSLELNGSLGKDLCVGNDDGGLLCLP